MLVEIVLYIIIQKTSKSGYYPLRSRKKIFFYARHTTLWFCKKKYEFLFKEKNYNEQKKVSLEKPV